MKLLTAAFLLILAPVLQPAAAQNYPVKPVRIIATSPPGGAIDFMSRLVAQELTPVLGQQFIVENRTGASGAIGTDHVAKSAPDGYTLLLGGAGPLTASPAFNTKVPFDPVRDFSPIVQLASNYYLIVVHPSVPARTLKELVALARRKPGALNFGSSGTAATPHLAVELFQSQIGIKMVHVPYKGIGPALTDLLGGQIDLIFAGAEIVGPHVQAGRLRALAATSPTRFSQYPTVPTVSETVLPGFEISTWYGLLAPARTPPEIINRLNSEVLKVLKTRTMQERLASQNLEPRGNTPQQFTAFVRAEVEKWRKLAKQIDLKL